MLVEEVLLAWSVAVRSIVFGPATTGTVSLNLPSDPTTWLLNAPPGASSLRMEMVAPASQLPLTATVEVVTLAPCAGDAIEILGGVVSSM